MRQSTLSEEGIEKPDIGQVMEDEVHKHKCEQHVAILKQHTNWRTSNPFQEGEKVRNPFYYQGPNRN